jgi:hypothetical protein
MSGTRLATNWIKFNVDLLHPIGSLCTLSEKVPGKFEYKNAVNIGSFIWQTMEKRFMFCMLSGKRPERHATVISSLPGLL